MIRRFANIFAAQTKTNEAERLTSQQKSDYMAYTVAAARTAPYTRGKPGLDRARSRKKLLRILGVQDGTALSLRLLRGALQSRDAGDVDIAVSLSFAYGLTPEHVAPLVQLVSAGWPRSVYVLLKQSRRCFTQRSGCLTTSPMTMPEQWQRRPFMLSERLLGLRLSKP